MMERRGPWIIMAGVMFIVGAAVLLVRLTHFNPLTGIYTYDPRTDQPSDYFLANRPDLVLVSALTRQIARDGTYPPTATASVVKVTPLNVDVSTYTDWQAYSYIATRLDYADGTWRVETFRFHSGGSEGAWLPLVGDITYHALFGRLVGCQPIPEQGAGQSACGLN